MISIAKRPPRGQTLLGVGAAPPGNCPPGPRAFAEIQFQIATSHSSHMTHMGHRAGEAVRGVAKQPYIEESRLLTCRENPWGKCGAVMITARWMTRGRPIEERWLLTMAGSKMHCS